MYFLAVRSDADGSTHRSDLLCCIPVFSSSHRAAIIPTLYVCESLAVFREEMMEKEDGKVWG